VGVALECRDSQLASWQCGLVKKIWNVQGGSRFLKRLYMPRSSRITSLGNKFPTRSIINLIVLRKEKGSIANAIY